jgi:hypothetical protein
MTDSGRKPLKNWLINLIGVTLGFLVSVPLVRHVTIEPLSWKFCITWCGLMWLIAGPIFVAIGALQDLENKRKARP